MSRAENLSAPQGIFLNELNTKFRAYVGGFGSGKTFVGCLDLLTFAGRHPKTVQGYFAPTYTDIRDTFYPTIDEAANMLGFSCVIRVSNKEVDLYRNRKYYGTIICRSMDNPGSIIGFKISRALVDEIDTMAKTKAEIAWNKIIARMRLKIDGVQNGIGVTTTPEGFLFVYSRFKEDPKESYSMVQASTYENIKHLPDDYIDSLLETYTPELVDAYVNGKFVNMKSGTVYYAYNRKTCNSLESVQHGELLRIGMDFNITNMSAVVYVSRHDKELRRNVWHAVDEFYGIYDTPAMISAIKDRYQSNGHTIFVYPDASGSHRTTSASGSDIALLRSARFEVRAHASNPLVKDRVLAANAGFVKKYLRVNALRCPEFAKCLEQLPYDKGGQPDKSTGFDHLTDAGTYPIVFEYPIVKPMTKVQLHGI